MQRRATLALVVGEPVIGVEGRVAIELPQRAVELLPARLGVDQDHDAWAGAILRVKVAGQRLEGAHGINAQVGIFAVIRAHVGVDHAIQKEVIGGAAHAVHEKSLVWLKTRRNCDVLLVTMPGSVVSNDSKSRPFSGCSSTCR